MTIDLDRFESILLRLEEAVRSGATGEDVTDAIRQCVAHVVSHLAFDLWVIDEAKAQLVVSDSRSTLDLGFGAPGVVPSTDELNDEGVRLISATTSIADHLQLCLRLCIDETTIVETVSREALQAILEAAADYYQKIVLERARSRVSLLGHANQLITAVHQSSPDQKPGVLATGLCTMWQVDRVSLCWKTRGQWKFAAGSADVLNSESSAASLALVDAVTTLMADDCVNEWVTLAEGDHENSPSLQLLEANGACSAFALPVTTDDGEDCVVLLESFKGTPATAEEVTLLTAEVQKLLTIVRRESRPVVGPRFSAGAVTILTLLFAIALLFFVQADFEISAVGQAYPQTRIRIFAPADGVIEDLKTENGAVVKTGTHLLSVADRDLELELQKVRGDLNTERTRLVSLKRGRSLPTSGDARGLAGEGATEKRIESLEKQQEILSDEEGRRTIVSPVDGVVLRANLTEELASRPVRRGQMLFEIVESNSAWDIRLRIRDRDIGSVVEAMEISEAPGVRFVLKMAPEKSHETELLHIDDHIQFSDSEYFCEGQARLPEGLKGMLKPGASVSARIYCGRRSLGFVLFRELFMFVREKAFAWF